MNQYEKMIGQAAIRTFGRIPNIIKAIEELSELQQALCKHIVSERDAMTVASVHEEIADVYIMLNRLMMLFDPTEVQDWKDSKLEHMAVLLGMGEEERGTTSSVTASPCHLPMKGKAFGEASECDKCARRGPCATCEGAEVPEIRCSPCGKGETRMNDTPITHQFYRPVICVKSGGPFIRGAVYAIIGYNNGNHIFYVNNEGDPECEVFHNFIVDGGPGELRLPDDPEDGPWMDYMFDVKEFTPNLSDCVHKETKGQTDGPEEPTGEALEEMRL